MRATVERFPQAAGPARHALDQAARELLLLQSSDWPFLISTGQAREYAVERFRSHLERFESLIASVEGGTPDPGLVERLWERDKVFPEIDYRWFKA
jgi:1,4-alpha-glucan branching enzyme